MTVKTITITCLLLFLAFLGFAQDSSEPKTMTYMKYRLDGPGLNEITSQTKEMWRIGKHEMRTLEPADTVKRIQPLVIFNPPDFWVINNFDSIGTHGVNNDPTRLSYSPIFSFMKGQNFRNFQFGYELEYVQKYGYRPVDNKDSTLDVYNFLIDNMSVSMTVDRKTQKPQKVSGVFDSNKYTVIYEDYQTGLKPDMSLFVPPDTTKITETKK